MDVLGSEIKALKCFLQKRNYEDTDVPEKLKKREKECYRENKDFINVKDRARHRAKENDIVFPRFLEEYNMPTFSSREKDGGTYSISSTRRKPSTSESEVTKTSLRVRKSVAACMPHTIPNLDTLYVILFIWVVGMHSVILTHVDRIVMLLVRFIPSFIYYLLAFSAITYMSPWSLDVACLFAW